MPIAPPASPAASPASKWERRGCIAIAVIAAWFYFWSVHQPGGGWVVATERPQDYYPLQAQGFREGHLYMSLVPRPELLALPDPYDPIANAPYRAHDLSLKGGHYFMYFGVTPVLLLFLPVSLLTGYFPTEPAAVALFCTAAVWAGVGLLRAVRRRYFPAAPSWALLLGSACMAFATPLTILAEAPQFYQVPIACAIFLQVLMLAAVYRSLQAAEPLRWLAVAGLMLGLSLGSRPNYLFSAVALLVPIAVWVSRFAPVERRQRLLRALASTFAPTAACGMALLAYNKARFGSFGEFGMHFQLAGERFTELTQISAGFIPSHYWLYLFGPGVWQLYFPFFSAPAGQPFGLLRYVPWMWLGLVALRQAKAPSIGALRHRDVFAITVGAAAWANLTLLACFFGSTSRYPGDFAQAWLLLAGVGALGVGEWAATRMPRLAGLGLGVLALVSLAVSGGAYCSNFPGQQAFPRVARALNWPVYAWQRAMHRQFGGLHLELMLPATPPAEAEPIFETGRQVDQRDWLQIEYLGPDSARFEFFHAGSGLFPSQEFAIPADRRITVDVTAGSLLPPFAFPVFSHWTRDDYENVRNAVRLEVNGKEVLNVALECYDSSPLDLRIGNLGWETNGLAPRFSGQVLKVARLPLPQPPKILPVVTKPGPIELSLYLPANKVQGADPLLLSGRGDHSDLLYCVYDGPNRLKLGFDHWGNGGPQSETVDYDPNELHSIKVLFSSLAGEDRGRLVVVFDDKPLLNLQQIFYPTTPATVILGYNRFRASSAGRQFNGRIVGARTIGLDQLPAAPSVAVYGAIDLSLIFPLSAIGASEPLVVTGKSGAGDLVYVRYLDPNHIAIGFDHWALGGVVSPPLEINYGETHRLTISIGSLYAPGTPAATDKRVRVKLDGVLVLSTNQATYPSTREEIEVGRNRIGGSSCRPAFTGRIVGLEHTATPDPEVK